MARIDYQSFFGPLFDREPSTLDDDEFELPSTDERPAMWADLTDNSTICEYPIQHFLPHLSRRSQGILKKLGVETVGDLLNLTPAQITAWESESPTSLLEIDQTILEFKGLSIRRKLDTQD